MNAYQRTVYTFTKQPKAQPGRIAITYRARLIGADWYVERITRPVTETGELELEKPTAITVLSKRIEGVTTYQLFKTENEAADLIDAAANTKLAMHEAWIDIHAMPKTPTA